MSVDSSVGEKIGEAQLVRAAMAVDASEFICKICCVHVVGSKPVLTACSHLFCGDCWQQRLVQDDAVPCPACEKPVRPSLDVFSLNGGASASCAVLWRMLQSLKVRCADEGCRWIGEYGDYAQHRRSGVCSCASGDELEPPPGLAHMKTSPPSTPSLCSGAPSLSEFSEDTSDSAADVLAESTTPSSATYGELLSSIQSLVSLEVKSQPIALAELALSAETAPTRRRQKRAQKAANDTACDMGVGRDRFPLPKATNGTACDMGVGRERPFSLSAALGGDSEGGARVVAPAHMEKWQEAFRWQAAVRAAQLQTASRFYASQMVQYQAAAQASQAMWAVARQYQESARESRIVQSC